MKTMLVRASTLALAMVGSVNAFAPTNFFFFFFHNLAFPVVPKKDFRLGANLEYGSASRVRNWHGDRKNVLRMYGDEQDALAMLASDPLVLNTLVPAAAGGVIDPAVTKISFDGKFEQLDFTLFTDYKLPISIFGGHTALSMHMPIRNARIKNVSITLPSALPARANVATVGFYNRVVSNDQIFKNVMNEYANGLKLDDWSTTGAGDLALMLTWQRNFKQHKDFIKTVDMHLKGGITIPTSRKMDADRIFSVSLGNEGAIGIPFGLGLHLNMKYYITLGADAEFLVLLDHAEEYRMKTSVNQTDFLLFGKGMADKDHGLTWKFNLFAQAFHVYKGLSAKICYQYMKHDNDTLTPRDNGFDTTIVNTAHSLKEWDAHNLIFQAHWDSFKFSKKIVAQPQLSLFCKVPIGGKRVLNPTTVGGQIGLNF